MTDQFNRRTILTHICRSVCFASIPVWLATWSSSESIAADLDSKPKGWEVEFPSMGSLINLRWFDPANDLANDRQSQVLQTAKKVAEHWVNILSDYEPTSESSLVCEQADKGDWVSVSEPLWLVMNQCDRWNRLSCGAFDAALGSVTRLRRQRKLATPPQWSAAKSQSGWHLLELSDNKRAFRTSTPGVRLDFGAIGKGLVVDAIASELESLGIQQYVLNSAGNMRIGKAADGSEGWPVSVDIPAVGSGHQDQREFFRWKLAECGVATSGDRWQRFRDPDQSNDIQSKSSHIVDPKTMRGITGHQSVTVIAKNGADADAIATATSVRASNKLSEWLTIVKQELPEVRILMLSRDNDKFPVRVVAN
jgi:FAD:protein FMN transferase